MQAIYDLSMNPNISHILWIYTSHAFKKQ